MEIIPKDLKKLREVGDREVVKKRLCNTLNTKVNSLQKKIPNAFTLIQTNQYNTKKSEVLRIRYLALEV